MQNECKKNGTKKKLIPTKKPPPQIRHTKTSLKRMLKANPLLELEAAGNNVEEFLKNHCKTDESKNSHSSSHKTVSLNERNNKIAQGKQPLQRNASCGTFKKPVPPQIIVGPSSSCAAERPSQFALRKSVSTGNLKTEEPTPSHLGSKDSLAPGPSNQNFVFKSPSSYQRRSIYTSTPGTLRKTSSSLIASTPIPNARYHQELQARLNKWLQLRGKRISSYQHLNCFGLHNQEEENKENVEVVGEKSSSYEDLKIIEPLFPEQPDEETRKLAKGALLDLLTLISEDYPRTQCVDWLNLIKNKYPGIDEEPEFWECKAAIEQAVGNVGNALEYYKNAIIHGAEVNNVEKSLDQLLKKFSLLHISPNRPEQERNADKERIVREARNVFKSTIIQFAIRENKKKSQNKDNNQKPVAKFVVTPVRRSTRLSRSAYVHTPGVTLCASLREINFSDEGMDFEKNKALC